MCFRKILECTMGAVLQNVDIQYSALEQQTTSKAQKEWNS